MTTMMHNTHGVDKDYRHHQQQYHHQRRRSRTQQQLQQQQQYHYSSDEKIVESTSTLPIPLLYSESPIRRTTNVSQTMKYVLDFFFKNQQLEHPLLTVKQQENRPSNSDRQRSISSSSSSSMIFRRITLILGSMSFLVLMVLICVVVVFTEQNHLQQRQQMELEFLSTSTAQQQQQQPVQNSNKNDWSSFSPSSSASVFDWISTTYSPHQQHQRHQHKHNHHHDDIDHQHHRIVGGHRIMSGLGAVPFLLTEFIQSVFSITSPSSSSSATQLSSSSSATSNGPIRLPWSTASSSSTISNTHKESPTTSDTASAGSSAHRRLRTSSASSSSSLPRSTSNKSSRRRRLFNRHVDEDTATAVAGTSADTGTSTSYIDEYGLRYLALGGKAFQVSNNSNNHDGGYASYPTMLSHNVRTVSSSSSSSFDDDDDDDDDDNPTLASLCTQSMIGNDEIYDVITIQYPLSAMATATSMTDHQRKSLISVGASSSSSSSSVMLSPSLEAIGLLSERLRQRFPDATIVFVDVWSPLDTYYYDNNRQKVTFEEWRKQKQQQEKQEMDNADESGPLSSSLWLDDIQDHVWYLKDDVDDVESLRRRTFLDELTELVDDADALLYRLRPSESVNDALQNYFVEHPMASAGTAAAAAAGDTNNFRYTLSSKAHSVMAADLESIIKTTVERTFASHFVPVSASSSSSQPLSPRLGTWGGGDSCQLWYEAGASMLPNQFSQGLRYIELTSTPSSLHSSRFGNKKKMGGWKGLVKEQGNERRRRLGTVPTSTTNKAKRRYALEVKSSNDSDQMKTAYDESTLNPANLQVHNPFEEDRMLYLTYLTTAATASSRKVYPRTKVHLQHGQPSSTTTTNPNKSGIIVLDPSHDDNSDVHHHTRTSAIGMVPAGQSSTVYFTPVEQYTEESFRIVGVSFLAKEKLTHGIKSDFHLSPHGITMEEEENDGTNAVDDDDDDTITS